MAVETNPILKEFVLVDVINNNRFMVVQLSEQEARILNYAYGLNGSNLRYIQK